MPDLTSDCLTREAAHLTRLYPAGTRIRFWPGAREGSGRVSVVSSAFWPLCGTVVVKLKGYPGCIAASHVERAL
jgi:hypothetical protein